MAGTGSVVVDGERSDCVSAHDRGLQYGDGLFETIALVNGLAQHWDRHLRRLERGCQRLRLPFPGDAQLADDFRKLSIEQPRQVLKIVVTRGAGGRGYRPPQGIVPTRILYLSPWPAYPSQHAEHGITARLCAVRLSSNPRLAGMKHLNRLEQVLAQGEWEDPQIAEGLMLDTHGNLIEGTMSNVFLVLDGVLCTPLLTECGISGIMREVIIEHCRSSGMPITERTIAVDRIRDVEEMFLCNSLIGIWPVRTLVMEEWQRDFPALGVAAVLRRQLQEREALPPDA